MIALLLGPACVPAWVDVDGDGVSAELDCDDSDPEVHPGAAERCGDDVDSDCDGVAAPAADQDCDGYAATDGDCDDAEPTVHPDADDACFDGLDGDCDGVDGPDGTCGPVSADLWHDSPGFYRFVADRSHAMFGSTVGLLPTGELVVGAHRYGDVELDLAAPGAVFVLTPPTLSHGELDVGIDQQKNPGLFTLWEGAAGDLVGESLAAGTGSCEGLLAVGSRSFGVHVLDLLGAPAELAAIPGGGGGADFAASMAVLADCQVAVGYPRYLGDGGVGLIELDEVSGHTVLPGAATWRLVYDAQTAEFDSTTLGRAVASADLDGDGLRELIVGDPNYGSQTGRVLVFSATDVASLTDAAEPSQLYEVGVDAIPLLTLEGEPASQLGIDLVPGPHGWAGCDLFGEPSEVDHVLALARDQDDAERDLANAGAWRLLKSLAGDTLDILGEAPADETCQSAVIEDFNGDAVLDLAVAGCWDAARAGLVYLFAGPLPHDATELRTLEDADVVLTGSQTPARANVGSSLAARRSDPTGPADLVVGAPMYGKTGKLTDPKEPGAVHVVPGSYLQTLLPTGSCAR